jgi:putative NADH-flavin reductase
MSNATSEFKALRVGVIGPAGFGGSYLCVELINRGHHVVGFSRNPGKLGAHARYTPIRMDVSAQGIQELARVFENVDVVVNEYGPHTAGADALQYSRLSSYPIHCALRKF